jgi:AraC-like DNA-binding protein
VISVAPLLREIILEVMRVGMLRVDIGEHSRLASVMADQIIHTRAMPLHIPYPSDRRALAVARAAQSNLRIDLPISDLVRGTGASVRTAERLFVQETGLTFGRWLQRVKVLHAIERLALGDSVTAAGLAVGYESTSAFIAMFKKVLGATPGSYFADPGDSPR